MKKQDLLKFIDNTLLEKLYGYCYARTNDSYEAQDLCSDIVFELVKASQKSGEIESVYPFIWKIAKNVYASFSEKRKKHSEVFYEGNPDDILPFISEQAENDDSSAELLVTVYRRIAFLTKAYREIMIMFYIDGLSTSEIAIRCNISETAVRQRLFTARQKLKSEVEEMADINNKPIALDKIDYVIWGTGSPGWGDPRDVCQRMFSKHIIWLCHKKAMSASDIAEELNVPTVYVEEELDILTKGANGEYGILRRLDNGKYAINIILFDKDVFEEAISIYTQQIPKICDIITDFINNRKDEYLSLPYINKKVDLNLILWQQIHTITCAFSDNVERILGEKHFNDTKAIDRPFSVFGYVDNGKLYGGGWDGVYAENICGYSRVKLDNIYITRIQKHFSCGLNVANEPLIQLAIRAIDGLDIASLSEAEKEHAAKAIECGYLFKEGEILYTKLLVSNLKDASKSFKISNELSDGYFDKDAAEVAEKIAKLIRKQVPDYLINEWRLANILANMPVTDTVVEHLIEKGILSPPENGIGAEGCWIGVEK